MAAPMSAEPASDDLQSLIGRTRRQQAVLAPELARRYAAATGAELDVEAHFPPLGHWAFFAEAVEPTDLGPDGHPLGGLFAAPAGLPRRMFAAAELRFEAALALGEPAELVSTVTGARRRAGRTGELALVDVERRLSQGRTVRLVEFQTIVYREASAPTPPVVDAGAAAGHGEVWTPDAIELFRYSAATWNSHRIHYDQRYAREAEGYPDLVVHGPFTAARLFDLAARTAAAPIRRFGFRALAPLFVGQPIRLRPGEAAGTLVAVRCDATTAMTAAFEA